MGIYSFPSIGYVFESLPTDVYEGLRKTAQECIEKAVPYNNNLVGHIQTEYDMTLENTTFSNYLLRHIVEEYDRQTSLSQSFVLAGEKYELVVSSLWLNKQKKHEFNPVHVHKGVYSFVVWLDIPYTLADEAAFYPDAVGENRAGAFEFQYTDALGRVAQLTFEQDKELEGSICVFPASLNHCVYPFRTTDKCRISVAGNIGIKRSA